MQSILSVVVLAFVGLVAASPLPQVAPTKGISQDLLDRFQLFRQYSTASYCPNNTRDTANENVKVDCNSNCPLVESAGATIIRSGRTPIGDIGAFLAVDDTNKLIVLAVRGTQSGQNVVVDALTLLIPSNICFGCLVHKGFYGAWLELRGYLLPSLNAAIAKYPGYQIVTTGHSLGAAIAIIAGAELRNAGRNVVVYSYGQPRIGNSVTANYISKQAGGSNTYRATHTDDPVPRLPDRVFGYRHTAPEYFITAPGDAPVGPADVTVLATADDPRGNAGTDGFNLDAHGQYFGRISDC